MLVIEFDIEEIELRSLAYYTDDILLFRPDLAEYVELDFEEVVLDTLPLPRGDT